MAILDDWAKAMSQMLLAAHGVSASITGHSLLLGDAREVLIRDVLRRFLPAHVVVGSGQILDTEGNRSAQIDIILYRGDFPILRTLGRSDVFLIEGVLAAIEVKSTIDKAELFVALNNCKSVRRLKPSVKTADLDKFAHSHFGQAYRDLPGPQGIFIEEHLVPPCYVFSFRGYKSDSSALAVAIEEWCAQEKVGVFPLPEVLVTEGCVGLKNLGLPFRYRTTDGRWRQFVVAADATPIRFLLSHLLERIMDATGRPVNEKTGIGCGLEKYTTPEIIVADSWVGVLGDVSGTGTVLPDGTGLK